MGRHQRTPRSLGSPTGGGFLLNTYHSAKTATSAAPAYCCCCCCRSSQLLLGPATFTKDHCYFYQRLLVFLPKTTLSFTRDYCNFHQRPLLQPKATASSSDYCSHQKQYCCSQAVLLLLLESSSFYHQVDGYTVSLERAWSITPTSIVWCLPETKTPREGYLSDLEVTGTPEKRKYS